VAASEYSVLADYTEIFYYGQNYYNFVLIEHPYGCSSCKFDFVLLIFGVGTMAYQTPQRG
jgi:hypothetical protein